ncbi:MAG: transporter [Alphaproteobacteria bacterium]|nr:transporter [Alphaproteobacteria bacterium]
MRYSLLAVTVVALGLVIALPPHVRGLASAAETAVTIPATATEIWQAIDTHLKELHADIDKGALNNVHAHAFAIRDLVRALPTHSPGLSADALAKVSTGVKFVDTLAERLDKTGDANDKAGTLANTDKLEKQLASIRANYPATK